MDSLIALLIVAVLILLNGVFVAAEFAIVGVPRSSIEGRARAGQRLPRIVRRILAQPREQDRFIATAQLGITFASLGLGMYGEHVVATRIAAALESLGAARWIAAHTVATVASVGLLTYFHIVLGEMVPKSIALQHTERTVLWITPLMLWTKVLLYPLVMVLNGVGNTLLMLVGINRHQPTQERFHTSEELELVVKESQEAGALPAESGRLLHEVFDFGDLRAGQVMTPRVQVVGISSGSPPEAIEEHLRDSPHTRYPVYGNNPDDVVGVIHIKDLLRLIVAGSPVDRRYVKTLPTVPETLPLDAVLAAMRGEGAEIALVIDEHGGTAGIVTLEDLFEEVVGEADETGSALPSVYVDPAGRLRVPGTTRLDEVGERFSVALRHEHVDSVSGLILAILGRRPRVGDAVRYAGLQFEVMAVRGLGVRECAVSRL